MLEHNDLNSLSISAVETLYPFLGRCIWPASLGPSYLCTIDDMENSTDSFVFRHQGASLVKHCEAFDMKGRFINNVWVCSSRSIVCLNLSVLELSMLLLT